MPVTRVPPPMDLIYAQEEENIESPPIPQMAETFFSDQIHSTPMEGETEEKKLHQELFSVSPIHGLAFIHSSKNSLEIVFWYLLIIAFIGIMIKDICQLVKQYQVQPTTTQVSMNFNKTIKPPLMFICVPIPLEDIENIMTFESQTLSGLSSVLNGLETKDQFLNSTDLSLFVGMYHYLAKFGMAERSYGVLPVDMSDIKYSKNPRERSTWKLEKKMISLNVTQEEIIRKTGATLATFVLGIEVTWIKTDGYVQGPASDCGIQLVSVDSIRSCFKINLNEIKSAEEYFVILVNMHYLLNQKDYYRPTSVSILFDGQDYEPSMRGVSKILAEPGKFINSKIEITGLFTVLSDNNGKQRCSKSQPQTYCIQHCRARFIHQKCGCVPLFGPTIPWTKGKTTCLLSHYSQCLKFAATDDRACIASCLPHCIKWTYRLDSTIETSDSPAPTASVFILAFPNFIYPTFQEVYALSWQNFLGDCGGTLGLWLGASFLSIIHVIIVACKMVITKFKFHWQCKKRYLQYQNKCKQ